MRSSECFHVGEDIYFMDLPGDDHYVYIYLDPRKSGNFIYNDLIFNEEPFYVGSGRKYRKRYHLYETEKCHKNKPKFFKIKKIKSLGMVPTIIEIYSKLSKKDSILLEADIMQKIGFKFNNTGPLLNFKMPGAEDILVVKLCGKNNPMFGKHIFDIWSEKYDEITVTNMITEYKKKMSISTSGEKNGMYKSKRMGSNNPNFMKGKKVIQYKDDYILAEWVNVPAAAKYINKSIKKSIKSITANIYKSIVSGHKACGFYWKYKKDEA